MVLRILIAFKMVETVLLHFVCAAGGESFLAVLFGRVGGFDRATSAKLFPQVFACEVRRLARELIRLPLIFLHSERDNEATLCVGYA